MTLDPPTRAALMAIADQAENALGLTGCQIAIVLHREDRNAIPPRYWLSIACDAHPELVRKMRTYFPARRTGAFRAGMGKLGDFTLDGVSLTELDAALSVAQR